MDKRQYYTNMGEATYVLLQIFAVDLPFCSNGVSSSEHVTNVFSKSEIVIHLESNIQPKMVFTSSGAASSVSFLGFLS